MFYFQKLPDEIFRDIISGELISADMHFYYYLLSKGGHGGPVFIPEKRMAEELNVSVGKVQLAIRRLKKRGHIERRKTTRGCYTKLLTIAQKKQTKNEY
jgi:DNA-binding MarR family transcriptional regulator